MIKKWRKSRKFVIRPGEDDKPLTALLPPLARRYPNLTLKGVLEVALGGIAQVITDLPQGLFREGQQAFRFRHFDAGDVFTYTFASLLPEQTAEVGAVESEPAGQLVR